MKRFNIEMKTCTKTLGKPFEGEKARCPIYNLMDGYLTSNGWTQTFFNFFKTGSGDLCETRYETVVERDVEGNAEEVLYVLEIIIKGSSSSCNVKAHLDTFLPSNKLDSISHDSEIEVLKGLEAVIDH
ncbi:MAG: hypothetical protein KAS67_05950 [Thermoplasmata archaeon]|nr:hypothetical protein [Thermoplasmata archaeon]